MSKTIFSENNRKEIQDIFKKMIKLAIKFYNNRNSPFKGVTKDFKKFFESYGWKFYTNLQTLQKEDYKGFGIYKEFDGKEYIKFMQGRAGWNGIYIWFAVSRNDIYMRIVTEKKEKCNALFKIQKDNILDYDFEEKIDKFEEVKDKLFDVFLYLSNYINNLSKDDFKIIKDNTMLQNKINLNQILYGPPGTGKTYHTIDKALEILGEKLENRDYKKAKFDEYVKNGQIVFTTFHQSYGYEEFVEGIKPIIIDDEKENSKEVEYEIKDGIFKKLCKNALNKEQKIKNKEQESNNSEELIVDNKSNSVWKISLGEKVRKDTENLQEYCFKNNQIRIGLGDTKKITNESSVNNFRSMQIGDLVCVLDTIKTIKAVGIIKSEVKYSKEKEFEEDYGFDFHEYQTYRDVEWILKNKIIDIYKLNNNTKLDLNTVYKLKNISTSNLIETIKDNLKDKFIIIIDEINRGNVGKIFGELITLIEPSKRLGEEEELRVRLPYSGEEFGVPNNVYIIGTMNTADRSITSLDTALRRRFEFVEMMPDDSKLSKDCEGVNLQELLVAINTRIEYLLDREKTIGHAFFIGVENLNDLRSVFQNKIIPLLQEYFYNDYALIDVVLNTNGMLKKENIGNKYLKNIEQDDDRAIWRFTDIENWDETTFKKIYE